MLLQASQRHSGSAHVVVLGNEKGGSGKSTIALHVAVALMKTGSGAASKALPITSTTEARGRAAPGLDLALPVHCCIKRDETMQISDNESSEFHQFMDAVSAIFMFPPIVALAPRAAQRVSLQPARKG